MKGRSFIRLFPSNSLSPSSNAVATARRGLLPEVCECVNTVAVEMRSWAKVCERSYSSSSSLPPFLPSSLAFFHSLPFACFSQSWSSVCWPALRSSLLSQSEGGEEEDRLRWQSKAVDGCVVGEGWMPLCAQVNCLWGQGLTQSSRCVYMPPFAAIWMCWTLLPSNIAVLFFFIADAHCAFVVYLL